MMVNDVQIIAGAEILDALTRSVGYVNACEKLRALIRTMPGITRADVAELMQKITAEYDRAYSGPIGYGV